MRKGVIVAVNNSGKMQTSQVKGLDGELADSVEVYQNYGFSSVPVIPDETGKGCEVVLMNDDGDMTVIVARDDRRKRPVVGDPGDVMMYGDTDTPSATHDAATQRITLTADGRIILARGNSKIILDDNSITMIGDVSITGTLTNNGVNVGSTHVHGGVQGGGGNTGTPS